VARSRHNNAVARNRAPSPREVYAWLTRLGRLFEAALAEGPPSSAVRKGLEPRRWGGPWGQGGGAAPRASGRFTSDGPTRGLDPSAGRGATSQKSAWREATGALRVAPVGVGAGPG
jgi:hypothetical protein